MLPLVYYTHADVKNVENINAKLDVIECQEKSLINSKPKKRLKLSVSDETMNYEAVEENDSPYVIGVLDKATGKLTVVETKFFVMKPECYLNKSQKKNDEQDKSKLSYSDRLNSLTEAFGSSKKRKAMHVKLKNKLDTETLDSAVDAAVKESLVVKSNESNNEEQSLETKIDPNSVEQFSIIPIPNKEAKKAAEIYNINEILINQSELDDYTSSLATKLISATREQVLMFKKSQEYPEFVCDRLLEISSLKNHQSKLSKCKLLAYANYLIKLHQLKSAQLRSKKPLNSISSEISTGLARKLLETYTVDSSSNSKLFYRTMPQRLKDKLVCHIMILGLTIDNFQTDLQSFQKDLKISVQKLSEYYQALGCHIKAHVTLVNNKKVLSKLASLTLPLFEVSKIQGKKRGRK